MKYAREDIKIIKHIIPVDKNDPKSVFYAVCYSVPEKFSKKAKAAMRYFDDTAFIFEYKGKLIVTDESLYLTKHGDGRTAPLGLPRWKGDSWDQLGKWLEAVYDDLELEGT